MDLHRWIRPRRSRVHARSRRFCSPTRPGASKRASTACSPGSSGRRRVALTRDRARGPDTGSRAARTARTTHSRSPTRPSVGRRARGDRHRRRDRPLARSRSRCSSGVGDGPPGLSAARCGRCSIAGGAALAALIIGGAPRASSYRDAAAMPFAPVFLVCFAAVPIAFLFGILRIRLARSSVLGARRCTRGGRAASRRARRSSG